jgi:hypothetical protein
MVRRNVLPWTLATFGLLGIGVRAASADPISFTGFAQNDFNPLTNTNVQVLPIDADPLNNIAETSQMLTNKIITGWAVKDLRLSYDAGSKTMAVGVHTYGVAGDIDGNGTVGTINTADPGLKFSQEPTNLGGHDSITVAFAANNPQNPSTPGAQLLVAGVPQQKIDGNTALDGFTVASPTSPNGAAIELNYGQTLTGHVGTLAFDPSSQHPNFEFTIPNFSTIPGIDPAAGFWVKVYSGSPDDLPVGEENSQWIHVPAFAPQTIPEPATWLAWTLAGGGLAWRRVRRGRGPSPQQ